MADKAQFTGVNEHFEVIFNTVSLLLRSYETDSGKIACFSEMSSNRYEIDLCLLWV